MEKKDLQTRDSNDKLEGKVSKVQHDYVVCGMLYFGDVYKDICSENKA